MSTLETRLTRLEESLNEPTVPAAEMAAIRAKLQAKWERLYAAAMAGDEAAAAQCVRWIAPVLRRRAAAGDEEARALLAEHCL